VRALVNKGWGGIGGDGEVPENIFMLDNTPHDWLFPKCAATVQHGGAGTVAIAMKCGKPTMIVPFFGRFVSKQALFSTKFLQAISHSGEV
jgi:UDP:flavonoid glycosyltransferase YjiC (YdhE family)